MVEGKRPLDQQGETWGWCWSITRWEKLEGRTTKLRKRSPSFPSLNPCLLNSYYMPGTAAFTEFAVYWESILVHFRLQVIETNSPWLKQRRICWLTLLKSWLEGWASGWLIHGLQNVSGGFPGDSVVKNPPANAGDTNSIPDPGRPHMVWSK